jgi:dUTP pyrophosphatase
VAGLIRSRSGLAARDGVNAFHGLIDSDYRGEVIVMLASYVGVYGVQAGDRIAQITVVPVPPARLMEVDELPPTDRGHGGFGSTGRAGNQPGIQTIGGHVL